VGETCGR